ncbi:MAG: PaaI family thioesterase [candidate division WOR-3 bacterium]|nr:PaaI family thioesterase [candidate division WOR-3 bacterium]MCX7757043.1 PaaI family thioesterase [candidate division WOR-3 bacterium]MDW7987257.1 PaaI family thioesterase [candidate division WOR-3 bacterium]
MIVKNTNRCFACGDANPIGLKLKFAPISNGVEAKFVPSELYEGFQNIIHGGIIATLLDEAIAWACRRFGVDAVTGELTVRYKKPLFTNTPVKIVGIVEQNKGKLLYGKAYIEDAYGTVIASATAKMVRANQ